MTQKEIQIRISDLWFHYARKITALKGISLQIGKGERVALIGHNGSGKSTLARQLNGLLRPSKGGVWIEGVDTAGETTAQLAGRAALLFQNPDDQICRRRVREEVGFGPESLGYPREKTRRLVETALSWFDLTSRQNQNPHDLRYGERKRLGLASVVAMDTPVIVLDEPTAGLDPGEIELLSAAMEQITARGRTLIVITHDMDFAVENLDRFICLSRGRKIFDGGPEALFANGGLLEGSNLLPPQMVRLSTALLPGPAMTPEAFVRLLGCRPNPGSTEPSRTN